MMKKMRLRLKQANEADASLSSNSVSDENQDCKKRIHELECENQALQKQIKKLKYRLENISASSLNSAQKLREDYLQKLTALEDQVTELKKKQDVQSQFSTQRHKVDGDTKQLHLEIEGLKAQKVQLQCKIKLDSVLFRLSKASLEKEVHQLEKERRRSEYEISKLLASNQRLKMVLQRKTEEASMVTKQLRGLLEIRKTSSNRRAGARNGNIPMIQGVEHEIEAMSKLHELCSKYEHQMEAMAEEVAKLKEEADTLKQEKLRCLSPEKDIDFLKDMDINDLKEQMDTLSDMVRQLRIKKAESIHPDGSREEMGPPSISSGSNISLDIDSSESGNSEGSKAATENTALEVCCSCSKKSLCKTTKCKCRSSGGSCGRKCGCVSSKCSNREAVPVKLNNPQALMAGVTSNGSGIGYPVKSGVAASQGARSLQSALVS